MSLNEEYSNQELLTLNVQFLGLKQKAWSFSRGARTERVYENEAGEAEIKDVYEYTMDSENRSVVSVVRKLEWYDEVGVKFLEKDISPELNIKNLKNLNRAIRQGRIDYMEAAAEELLTLAPSMPEPYATDFVEAANSIDIIMSQYENEISHYISRGTLEFENAILNESNPIMVSILNLQVRPPDSTYPQGLTIKQTILHQLTGSIS